MKLKNGLLFPIDRFLALNLVSSRLASLTKEKEPEVFEPFRVDLSESKFATFRTEMIRWRCKWEEVNDKPSTFIETEKCKS